MLIKTTLLAISSSLCLIISQISVAQPTSTSSMSLDRTSLLASNSYSNRGYRGSSYRGSYRGSSRGAYRGNYNSRNYYRGGYRGRTGYYPTRNYYRRAGYYQGPRVKQSRNYYGGVYYYPTAGYYPAPYNLGARYRNYQPYAYSGFRNPYGRVKPTYRRPYFYRTYYYPTNRYRHYRLGRPTSYRYGHYRYPARGNYVFWPAVSYRPGYTNNRGHYYYPHKARSGRYPY